MNSAILLAGKNIAPASRDAGAPTTKREKNMEENFLDTPEESTERETMARMLMEMGKMEAAADFLKCPDPEVLTKAEMLRQQAEDLVGQRIRELELRITILKMRGIDAETVQEIRDSYEIIVMLIKRYGGSLRVVYDYATFLHSINAYEDAIETAKWLLERAKEEKDLEENVAAISNLLGVMFMETNQDEAAEKSYQEALGVFRQLAQNDPEYNTQVADVYNNLGLLAFKRQACEEAEKFYRESIDIYLSLAHEDTTVAHYKSNLAGAYLNLAGMFVEMGKLADAQDYYLEAGMIYAELSKDIPGEYEPSMVGVYNNLGTLYCKSEQYQESEAYYKRAIDIARKLAQANPAIHEPLLAEAYYNLGLLYMDLKHETEAKNLLQKAKGLWAKYPFFSFCAEKAQDFVNRLEEN